MRSCNAPKRCATAAACLSAISMTQMPSRTHRCFRTGRDAPLAAIAAATAEAAAGHDERSVSLRAAFGNETVPLRCGDWRRGEPRLHRSRHLWAANTTAWPLRHSRAHSQCWSAVVRCADSATVTVASAIERSCAAAAIGCRGVLLLIVRCLWPQPARHGRSGLRCGVG